MTNNVEILLETTKIKYNKKIELEKVRHDNIMEELAFMAKNKIKHFDRYLAHDK